MAWSGRYSKLQGDLPPGVPPLFPGGRSSLILIMGSAGAVILSDVIKRIS
jgi:hypothetical protein